MVEGEVDEEGMEIVYEDVSDSEDSDDELPASEITYGDSTYELVLPSGARIGHRAHTRIHKQNLAPYLNNNPFPPTAHSSPHTGYKPSPHSKALLSLVPMQSDKSHARPLHQSGLIRTKNGNVIRARNKGEAKEAQRDRTQYREVKAHSDFAFIRGVIGNSQKHVRYHFLACHDIVLLCVRTDATVCVIWTTVPRSFTPIDFCSRICFLYMADLLCF